MSLTTKELLIEFKDLYQNPPEPVPQNTDGIIVLMGPDQKTDIYRIKHGLDVLKTLGSGIPLIFSGTTESREEILSLMEQLGVPTELAHYQDCGKLGVANTKTQFEALIIDPLTKDLKDLVLVTSAWHVPRVKRTAGKFLPLETSFVVVGRSDRHEKDDSFLKVLGEIERIMVYSAKGDILARPR